MALGSQLRHAWNAFVADRQAVSQRRSNNESPYYGRATTNRPDTHRLRHVSDKTILTAIYMRLAVDASGIEFRHIRNENDQYKEDIKSYLNECLTVEANLDQAARAFFLDIYWSLFDWGYLAIVPVDTTLNPDITGGYDVVTMRVGQIVEWMPKHVKVSVYDQEVGDRFELTLPKKNVAIVHNPFYAVMNEGASVLQRLVRKLSILDTVDEASASGKLDLLIQLPYTIKTDTKRKQAEDRHRDLEVQLKGSQYGIGYIDGTEKVIQLNRPSENNVQTQIEYLVNLLFSQLGLSPEIMNGTADEATMLNYMNRTILPMVDAVKQGMLRSFLTKTARTQGQTLLTFRDPFALMPLSQIAELADKLLRNEAISPNEIRPKLGLKPSSQPGADQLANSNMVAGTTPGTMGVDPNAVPPVDPNATPVDPNAPPADTTAAPTNVSDFIDQMNKIIDDAFKGLPGASNGG